MTRSRDYVIIKRDGKMLVRQWRSARDGDAVLLSDPLAYRAAAFSTRSDAVEAAAKLTATA